MLKRKAEPPLESLPLEQQIEQLKEELEPERILYTDRIACAWRRHRDLIEGLLVENEALHRLLQAEREHHGMEVKKL